MAVEFTARRHVVVNGQRHIQISHETLFGLCYETGAPIEYPLPGETVGFATTRIDKVRFAAAWDGGVR